MGTNVGFVASSSAAVGGDLLQRSLDVFAAQINRYPSRHRTGVLGSEAPCRTVVTYKGKHLSSAIRHCLHLGI